MSGSHHEHHDHIFGHQYAEGHVGHERKLKSSQIFYPPNDDFNFFFKKGRCGYDLVGYTNQTHYKTHQV